MGKLEMVKNTRMIDYAIDIYKLVYETEDEIPSGKFYILHVKDLASH